MFRKRDTALVRGSNLVLGTPQCEKGGLVFGAHGGISSLRSAEVQPSLREEV